MSTYEKIGIIAPMEVEAELLNAAMEAEGPVCTTTACGRNFREGTLGGQAVIVVKCGEGMVNAAACAQALVGQLGADAVINTGIGGSLDSSIKIGEIVIADDTINHVIDLTALGYEAGQTPDVDCLAFAADQTLTTTIAQVAQDQGIIAYRGRIASGDVFVCSDEQKEHIISTFGAICCEMEGAAIAQVCHLSNVPFAIVRAISDNADDTSGMDCNTFEKMASHASAALVIETLKRLG